MTDKLALYNDALLVLGQERLGTSGLAEASTARYALDDAYDKALKYCLEQGFWNVAMRSVMMNAAASIEPAFGYQYAFTKPPDFVRLYTLSAEETLRIPLLEFVDEVGYWFANSDPLYGKFVSSHTSYGLDLSIWPETFADYVAKRLAGKTCKRITGSDQSEEMKRDEKRALSDARSKDAMNEPPGFPPAGSWVTSRTNSCDPRGSRR